MTEHVIVEYTGLEVFTPSEIHYPTTWVIRKAKYDFYTGKALDANLVDTESIRTDSIVQDDSIRSGNDTDAGDADIRPIYDEEPMAEIHRKVLGKPVLPSLRNQSVVRQPNAFKSARAQMSKQRFASQVDVNKNLSKPVTQHYLPKKTESTFLKKEHKEIGTQHRVVPYLSARIQTTTDDRKPNPRSNNQTSRSLPVSKSSRVTITAVPKADHSKSSSSFSDSKNFVCSTCHKCVFNANHDACITKLLKEVNSRAKIQSNKTTNSNKPVDQKSHTQKPSRQIFTGHRFSPNKTSAVSEKTSPRSDLRWKPTGRIFKSVGLRWIPTGKLFDSCTSKVDSEPPHGSNVDIPNIHECKQTLDSMVAEKADISETIVKVDSQMMIQKDDVCSQ
ncbi:hypothetical protein Tco_1062217 [Tanacetum coccineum]